MAGAALATRSWSEAAEAELLGTAAELTEPELSKPEPSSAALSGDPAEAGISASNPRGALSSRLDHEASRPARVSDPALARDTDPSPPPSLLPDGDAIRSTVVSASDPRALAAQAARELESDELDTPRRSRGVISNPRSTQTEQRLEDLEERVRALDARLRLTHKSLTLVARISGALALLLLASWLAWLLR
ncbi:MAG TPA: hypothetical protein VLC09_19800 [Polyangiaceae bacterium]|nr:hypothetical protein [Polyangiaceae bacterium]